MNTNYHFLYPSFLFAVSFFSSFVPSLEAALRDSSHSRHTCFPALAAGRAIRYIFHNRQRRPEAAFPRKGDRFYMRVLKIILIVLVAIALTSAIIHAFFFHGGLFLGLPFLHAGRLLRMLVFATGSVLAFVWGVGVKRPGLRWLKIALLSLGVILAVLAFVNLMGAL
jgi:hypothetical protein